MRIVFFLIAGSLLFVCACTPEEEDIPCVSTFDCPEGMECSPEGVCVEATGGGDTWPAFDDQSLPRDDASVVGDEVVEQNDEAMVDEQFDDVESPADESVLGEDDPAVSDDGEEIMDDEEGEVLDDTMPYPDEDTVPAESEPFVPEEEVTLDEGMETDVPLDLDAWEDDVLSDEDAFPDEVPDLVDEDPVLDEDSAPDLDVVEKVKIIGTDTFTNTVPWSPNYAYRYSAAIYPKAQVSTVPITITRLAWNSSTSGTSSVTANIKILLKETNDTIIPSQIAYTTVKNGAVEVFSGTLTGTQGWNEKVLDTPFAYSGTKNLMVLTELTVASPGSTRFWYYSGTSSNTTHSWYGSSDPASSNGINNEGLPNLRVTYY